MKITMELPEGYVPIKKIDVKKDKRIALTLHGGALLLTVLMILIAHRFLPITLLLDWSVGPILYFARPAVLLAGMFLYIVLRVMTQGLFIRMLTGKRAQFGFTGLYTYIGSKAYFNKKQYFMIALIPVAIWTIILLVLNCMVPMAWFWVIYIIQVCNVASTVGDIYVVCLLTAMPSDLLIQDLGVSMTVYSPTNCATSN